MSPFFMRGDLMLSRYVWQATSQMSFDQRILYPCLMRARSEPPQPLKSEIAEVVICPGVYGRFYSGDRNSPRILGAKFPYRQMAEGVVEAEIKSVIRGQLLVVSSGMEKMTLTRVFAARLIGRNCS